MVKLQAPKHIAWLRSLIGSELVVRATKHVFRGLFQSVKVREGGQGGDGLQGGLLVDPRGDYTIDASNWLEKRSFMVQGVLVIHCIAKQS